MPAKSLRLGPLQIPDEWMQDFLRGCIDGDGSIVTYTDRYNTFKKSTYVYTRVYLSLVSASPRFVEWLRETLRRLTAASGHVGLRRTAERMTYGACATPREKRFDCFAGCITAPTSHVFAESTTLQLHSCCRRTRRVSENRAGRC